MQSKSIFKQLKVCLNPVNTTLAKYLMRKVSILLLAVFLVIGLVLFGNQLVLVVKESLREGIPVVDLLPLISLKIIKDMPLILSLSLFLAIILAFAKLYKESEAIVMNSIGVGDKHFVLFIQPIVIFVVVLALFLTTVVVPWSKEQKSIIMQRTENSSEFSLIKQGEFQTFKGGDIVFYSSAVKDGKQAGQQEMQAVFIYALINGKPIITLAKQAQKYTDPISNSVYLHLKDGRRYHGFPSENNKRVLDFDSYDLQIIDGEQQQSIVHYSKVEGRSTLELFGADGLDETAELQWRFSQPFSILILSVLAILLGKTSPRGGKNLGVLIGVVVFILYNNVLLIAKSSLENGSLSPVIGLWWVHILIGLLIFIFYSYQHGKLTKIFTLFSSKITL